MSEQNVTETELDLSGDGGVKKLILQEGVGEELPSKGCRVSLHYTGTLLDGTQFDSSVDRGVPFEFELGRESVIKAFDMGVATMKKGEKCVLTCAPEYAYGAAGSGPNIPPNATLKFELEMLSWELEDLSPDRTKGILRDVVKASDKKRTPNEFAHVHVRLVGKYGDNVFEDREVKFDLGEGATCGVVSGVEIALEKFHQYETSRLILRPEFAFGANGNEEFGIPGNATVEYTVTLREFERSQDTWKLDTAESLQQAQLFKDKGAKYIKEEKYQVAIKMLKRSNDYLSNCPAEDAKALKTAVYLNKALCYQKLEDPFEVKQACDSVLEIDQTSVKAFYRRGQAFMSLGNLEAAMKDFQEVQQLEPSNKAAQNQITLLKHKLREANEKERKIYANMFTKFANADKQ
ncbi:FK506-binding protein 59 isoform X2 [Phlebotomus argentipes]|nr:FK506-binding protein 59 isoform X2 [Phlebotomus argentipes]